MTAQKCARTIREAHAAWETLARQRSGAVRIPHSGASSWGPGRPLQRHLHRRDPGQSPLVRAAGPRRQSAAAGRLASNDPSREDGVSARNAWPQRTQTHWSYYRTNDVVHSTYWIAEWPRIEVGPDFMAPLLVQTRCMRTVSVTMEPVPPLKAMRAVGFAKTADVADEELRQKLGFIGTAKRRNQADAVARREQELTSSRLREGLSRVLRVPVDRD